MSLIIGERVEDSLGCARWRATDSESGDGVGVKVSHEALHDKGESACLSKAQYKYDGSSPSVDVTTADF